MLDQEYITKFKQTLEYAKDLETNEICRAIFTYLEESMFYTLYNQLSMYELLMTCYINTNNDICKGIYKDLLWGIDLEIQIVATLN